MSNKQQTDHIADSGKMVTSVDWLENRLIESGISFLSEEIEFIKQAKEMFEQQIMDAHNQGEFNQGCNGSAEDYYKETYE